jgi:enoyl-CoA hydratase/carnithine racemase
MNFENIIYEKEDSGIAIITLNRPEVMNAQNIPLKQDLRDAVEDARDDDNVRALILTGAGRGFSAGDDIREMWLTKDKNLATLSREGQVTTLKGTPRRKAYLQEFWKPAIAAVNGPAVGAGLELAMECDIRIASENAKFGYFFVLRNLQGTHTPDGLMKMLYSVGNSRAMEFLLSGEFLEAEEATRIGIASKMVPADKLIDEARAMANKLMKAAPLAQLAIKQLVRTAMFDPTNFTQLNSMFGTMLRQSEDHAEAAKAFAEKRPANFKMR